MFIASKATKLEMIAVIETPSNFDDDTGIVIEGYTTKPGGVVRKSISFSIEGAKALQELLNEWNPPADK